MSRIRLLPALMLAAFCALAWSADDGYTPLTASPAKGSGFKDFSGKPREISEFTGKGKWTIVMIWASDCHVCNAEVQQYVDFHNKHKDRDATVLGLSADGWEGRKAAQDFVDRNKVSFPNLLGSGATIIELYEGITGESLAGTPAFLVFDPKGKIAAKQVGAVPVRFIEEFIARSG